MSQRVSCEKNTSEAFKSEKFWTVSEASLFLSVKPSTIYQWVHLKEIPHYKIGRIVRFRRRDLEAWVEGLRLKENESEKKVRTILKEIGPKETEREIDIDLIIRKSIADAKGKRYTPCLEKPGRVKGLRKEVEHGAI